MQFQLAVLRVVEHCHVGEESADRLALTSGISAVSAATPMPPETEQAFLQVLRKLPTGAHRDQRRDGFPTCTSAPHLE
jgi:hypothetical protein